jgi:hypothetical protein
MVRASVDDAGDLTFDYLLVVDGGDYDMVFSIYVKPG